MCCTNHKTRTMVNLKPCQHSTTVYGTIQIPHGNKWYHLLSCTVVLSLALLGGVHADAESGDDVHDAQGGQVRFMPAIQSAPNHLMKDGDEKHGDFGRSFSMQDAQRYLKTFGYLENDESIEYGLKRFQDFAKLTVTGTLTKETIEKMQQPRCGNRDIERIDQEIGNPMDKEMVKTRHKRYYIEGSYWGVKEITYKITDYTSEMDKPAVDDVISRAFKVWEEYSPLRFVRGANEPVNIEVQFKTGAHGDGEPFDGRGQILAHAFFPRYGGDVHFDDAEPWRSMQKKDTMSNDNHRLGTYTIPRELGTDPKVDLLHQLDPSPSVSENLQSGGGQQSDNSLLPAGETDRDTWTPFKTQHGIDLYSVAAHEIGHSLGLKHSEDKRALMAPFYQGYHGDAIHLQADDVTGLQRLYGKPPTPQKVTVDGTKTKVMPPSLAAGDKTKSDGDSHLLTNGIGKTINDDPLPKETKDEAPPTARPAPLFDICREAKLDALTVLGNGTTYAFRGDLYWRLNELSYDERYPRRIGDDWDGLPGNLDAAVTDYDGDTYFFKGSEYWLYNPHGQRYRGYPRQISLGLVDMPDNIDAALIWNYDDKPYFFKGNDYWQYSRWGMPKSWPKSVRDVFENKNGSPEPPIRVDAAIKWTNGKSYIFTDNVYYRLNSWHDMKVVSGYPRDTAEWWFGCQPKNRAKRHIRDYTQK